MALIQIDSADLTELENDRGRLAYEVDELKKKLEQAEDILKTRLPENERLVLQAAEGMTNKLMTAICEKYGFTWKGFLNGSNFVFRMEEIIKRLGEYWYQRDELKIEVEVDLKDDWRGLFIYIGVDEGKLKEWQKKNGKG